MKKLIYILDSFRVSTFSANFQFGVNYSFKIFGEKHLYFQASFLRVHFNILKSISLPPSYLAWL